ncbi:outer membrane beta-barrel protein [Dyadobacter crusticola]|uniref:outer membrane beta-barrel protein n=1 Tax=Dyadobacter crusticola TaxID=292407 RepID=UPI0004E1B380|nr:outer membrane beta-barrel protein [Dyadobacter crusticola]
MIRALSLLLAFVFSAGCLFGQNPAGAEWRKDREAAAVLVKEKDANVNKPPRWEYGLNGGYAYRLFRPGRISDLATKNYIDDLKSGFAAGANVSYFHWEKVGFGLQYEYYQGEAAAADGLKENVTIQHLSGSVIYRHYLKNHTTSVLSSFMLGYQPYQNKAALGAEQLTFTGKTMGWGISVGLEQKISRHFALNLTGSAMMGAIYRMKRKTGISTQTLHLSKDDSVDLSRASLTLGLRFF